VELTSNEVSHSGVPSWETQLIVVDQIAWTVDSGTVITSGGRLRRWREWQATEDRLKATRYRYQLPDGEDRVKNGPSLDTSRPPMPGS
jgi:hypothetical protein